MWSRLRTWSGCRDQTHACLTITSTHDRDVLTVALFVCAFVAAVICLPKAYVIALAILAPPRSGLRARALIRAHSTDPARVERLLRRCDPEALARAVCSIAGEFSLAPAPSTPPSPNDGLSSACYQALSSSPTLPARAARLAIISSHIMSPDLLRSLIRQEQQLLADDDAVHFDQLHRAAARARSLDFEALAPLDPYLAIDLVWAAQIQQRRDVTPPSWSRTDVGESVMLLQLMASPGSTDKPFDTLGEVAHFIETCMPMEFAFAPALALVAASQALESPDLYETFSTLTKPFRDNPSCIAGVASLLRAGASASLADLADVAEALEL